MLPAYNQCIQKRIHGTHGWRIPVGGQYYYFTCKGVGVSA